MTGTRVSAVTAYIAHRECAAGSKARGHRVRELVCSYDDRLSGRIADELWTKKSAELEDELQRVRAEMARHERASHDYEETGVQILELAQSAYSLYVTKNPHDQAKLLKKLLLNCTFDRGSLTATYIKPFDLFAAGAKNGDWLLGLDSNQQPSG